MWSEHCCYKTHGPSSNFHTGARILVGPGENAGVVDFSDGLLDRLKLNPTTTLQLLNPSRSCYGSGILRDIFTMGARPIAVLNSLRFGSLEDARTQRLFTGVVSGIAHYGNCVGFPQLVAKST